MSLSGIFRSESLRLRPLLACASLVAAGGAPAVAAPAVAAPSALRLVPAPAELRVDEGVLPVEAEFSCAFTGADDARLPAAVDRMFRSWAARTDVAFTVRTAQAGEARLVVRCEAASPAVPRLGEDESYVLEVSPRQALLRAPTSTGALRGIATLTQLLSRVDGRWALPAVTIRDQPRFPWRGLMLDVVRHWLPLDAVKRQLDGMALVKLNVLHLHLTDDQGFRIESRTHPELQGQGSDGNYFTQDQVRDLLAYAHARGIRVVPEFDLPGHSTCWLVSHPELASAPGRYALSRRWDGAHVALDPTSPALFPLLEDFLGEMVALFPDDCVHIGGDEVDGVQWGANPRIREFVRANALKDATGLQAWFTRRLGALLAKHGRKLMGWDEILQPGLPADWLVHSWHGGEAVVDATRAGHPVVVSSGYYLSNGRTAAEHYAVDPLPAGAELTPAQQALVLGGEAAVWTEWFSADNLDRLAWPGAAAVAERLWSPRAALSPGDLYVRLAGVEERLREAGLFSGDWPRIALPGLAPHGLHERALRVLAAAVEPVESHDREELQPDLGQTTPLNELADWARPDNRPARDFGDSVERWLMAEGDLSKAAAAPLTAQFHAWAEAGELAATAPAADTPRAQGRVRTAHSLAALGRIGTEAVVALQTGRPQDAAWAVAALQAIADAKPNAAAVRFPFLPQLRLLVAAAGADPAERGRMPRAEWRARLERTAAARP